MCVIVVKKAGIPIPGDDILNECFSANKDGAGISYLQDDKIIVHKGLMDYAAFKTKLDNILSTIDSITTPMLFHFRIGTHGSKNAPEHTHPFPLVDDYAKMIDLDYTCDTAIAHNGIAYFGKLVGYGGRSYTEKVVGPSDSMELIAKVFYPLSELNPKYLTSEGIQNILKSILNTNKIVFFSKDGFITFGDFIEDKGILYSNSSYRPIIETKTPTSKIYDYNKKSYQYDNYKDYENYLDDDIPDDTLVDNKKRPLLNYSPSKEPSHSAYLKYLHEYNAAVAEREYIIGKKWRGKENADYDKIIRERYTTFYYPADVTIVGDGNKENYTMPIISPFTPWYISPDDLSIHFFSMTTGYLSKVGDIATWSKALEYTITSKVIGWKYADYRLWNKAETRYHQGVWLNDN
jgi:hypothetical protein